MTDSRDIRLTADIGIQQLGFSAWIWHKTSVPTFLEKFVLPLCVGTVILLVWTNPMGFDTTQRITGAAAIIFTAFFVGHTLNKPASIKNSKRELVDAASQEKPVEGSVDKGATAKEKNEKPKAPPPNVTQESHGDNSPNTAIVGDNNTVINGDPKVSAKLDEIKELLRAQQGESATPKQLLRKYPFGYAIFDVDYSNVVFPYHSEALEKWAFDWTVVKITDMGNGYKLRLPDLRSKDERGIWMRDYSVGFVKKIGPFEPRVILSDGRMDLTGEVLAITNKGVVFVLGFADNTVPMPAP